RQHIGDPLVGAVRRTLMGLVTLALPARVDEHERVLPFEGVHIAEVVPVGERSGEPRVERERRAAPLHFVMDADPGAGGVWHGDILSARGMSFVAALYHRRHRGRNLAATPCRTLAQCVWLWIC